MEICYIESLYNHYFVNLDGFKVFNLSASIVTCQELYSRPETLKNQELFNFVTRKTYLSKKNNVCFTNFPRLVIKSLNCGTEH